MKIIESFSKGKANSDALNEDRIVELPGFIAVLDGATSKVCPKIDGRSAGRFAVDCADDALRSFKPDITAREAVDILTQTLHESVRQHVSLPDGAERPAFVMAIYSRAKRDVWRVGDAKVMLDGIAHDNDSRIDDVLVNARALRIVLALELGATPEDIIKKDIGREFILPLLKEQHAFANNSTSPFCYPVMNGLHVPDQLVEIFNVQTVKEIVLSTDGYPQILPTHAASEEALKKVLTEDPLLYRLHKSTKGLQAGNISFDDRSYIRFRSK